MKTRTYSAAVIKAEGEGRTFTARITAEGVDRDREVMIPQGMDPTEFNKNGAIFWNHDYDRPIGKSLKLTKDDRSWSSHAVIASRPEGHEGDFFPDTVWALIQQGIIKGVSVGFDPIEERHPTKADKDKWGESVRNIVSKWKLLEWSIAPLQANTEAVITAVGKGLIARDVAVKAFPGIKMPEKKRTKHIIFLNAKPKQDPEAIAKLVSEQMRKRMGALYA